MCLATPVQVQKIQGKKAFLTDGRQVDLVMISNARAGDWLLCHADLAINKISKKEAQDILELTKSCGHSH